MEYYYGILFLLAAIFQEHIEGRVVASACSVVGFFTERLVAVLVLAGHSAFLSTGIVDLILVFIALNLITSRIGVILFIASGISLMVNMVYWVNFTDTHSEIYDLIQPYYSVINIIIFEVLLYSCILHSKLYKWGKYLYEIYIQPRVTSKREN